MSPLHPETNAKQHSNASSAVRSYSPQTQPVLMSHATHVVTNAEEEKGRPPRDSPKKKTGEERRQHLVHGVPGAVHGVVAGKVGEAAGALDEVDVGADAGRARGAGGDLLDGRPDATGAALEGGAADAVPVALGRTGAAGGLAAGGSLGGRLDGWSGSIDWRLNHGLLDWLLRNRLLLDRLVHNRLLLDRLLLNRLLRGGRGCSGSGGGGGRWVGRHEDAAGNSGLGAGSRLRVSGGWCLGRVTTTVRGAGGTASDRGGKDGGGAVELLDDGTGIWELDVGALGGGTAVADVGLEHVGQGREGAGRARGTGDSDRCAVHVHLAIADLVEPGPGEHVLAGGQVLGDVEAVLEGHLQVGVVAQVARSVLGRAAALDGLNDLPDRVDGGLEVSGDGDLAGAAAVDGGALEGQLLGAALGVGVDGAVGGVGDGLAGVVAAAAFEGAAARAGEGDRVGHEDVRARGGNQSGESERFGEHFDRDSG